jgi:O-antigen ligase
MMKSTVFFVNIILFISICLGAFALIEGSGSPISVYVIFVPLVFLCALATSGSRGFGRVLKSKIFLPFFLYLTFMLFLPPIGVLLGIGQFHLITASYFSSLIPIFMIFSGFSIWKNMRGGEKLNYVITLSIIINFMLALSQFMLAYFDYKISFFSSLLDYQYDMKNSLNNNYDIRGRASGVFIGPNDFGFWSAMLLGYVFSIYKKSHLKIVLIIMLIFCLFASNSRGALLAFLFSFLIVVITNFKSIFKYSKLIIAGLFILVILSFFNEFLSFSTLSDQLFAFFDRFTAIWGIIAGTGVDDNLNGRLHAWSSAVSLINQYPFGTFIPPETLLGIAADNQYVYLYLQGGLVLFVSYFFMLCRGAIIFYYHKNYFLYWSSLVIIFYGLTAYPMNSYSLLLYWIFIGGSIYEFEKRKSRNEC